MVVVVVSFFMVVETEVKRARPIEDYDSIYHKRDEERIGSASCPSIRRAKLDAQGKDTKDTVRTKTPGGPYGVRDPSLRGRKYVSPTTTRCDNLT